MRVMCVLTAVQWNVLTLRRVLNSYVSGHARLFYPVLAVSALKVSCSEACKTIAEWLRHITLWISHSELSQWSQCM